MAHLKRDFGIAMMNCGAPWLFVAILLGVGGCTASGRNHSKNHCSKCGFFAQGDTLEWEWSNAQRHDDTLTLIINYAVDPVEVSFDVKAGYSDSDVAKEAEKELRSKGVSVDAYRNYLVFSRQAVFRITGKKGPYSSEEVGYIDLHLGCGLKVNVVLGTFLRK